MRRLAVIICSLLLASLANAQDASVLLPFVTAESGGQAGGWTPLNVAGLVMWVDASDTVYTNVAGTMAASVGQTVAYVPDKSGYGRHITQATANRRPTLSTQYGRRGLLFDASNDFLASAAYACGRAYTCIVVAQRNWITPGGYRATYVHSNVDTSNDSGGSIGPVQAGASYAEWRTSDLVALGNGNALGTAPRVVGSIGTATTNAVVLAVIMGATRADVYVNGVRTTKTGLTGALNRAGTSYPAYIGNRFSADHGFGGHIYEVMAWTNEISALDLGAAITNSMTKWGIE